MEKLKRWLGLWFGLLAFISIPVVLVGGGLLVSRLLTRRFGPDAAGIVLYILALVVMTGLIVLLSDRDDEGGY